MNKIIIILIGLFGIEIMAFAFKKDDRTKQMSYARKVAIKYYPFSKNLQNELDDHSMNSFLFKDTFPEYLFNLPDIIHEAFHIYCQRQNMDKYWYKKNFINPDYEYFNYHINDTMKFKIKFFDMPRVLNAAKLVPQVLLDKESGIRPYIYEEVIWSGDKVDTLVSISKYKFFQLFEEYICEYHSFRMQLGLYNYLIDSLPKYKTPIKPEFYWLSAIRSNFNEVKLTRYKLFMAIYLAYLYEEHNDIFKKITNNFSFKKVYTFIDSEDKRMRKEMRIIKDEILNKNKGTVKITKDDFFWIKGKGEMAFMHTKQTKFIDSLIATKQFRVIDSLLIK